MAEHTGAFSKFMGLCDKVTGHDQEVLKLIKKRHQRAKADFIQSEGFIKLLQHTSESITKDTSNKYVHIKDLLTELKAYQDQPIKPNRISNLHGESHTDSSARKRMFDSDTDSIPDVKRYHIDVSTDLDENSKDSNISEPTIEGHQPVKKNHEGNCDSSTLAARHAHLDDIEELSAGNGASVLSPNKQKLNVLVTDCVSSKRYKNAAAGDVETLETNVGNGGDGLGNGGNIFPYAGMAGEGALDIGDRCRSSEVADSSAAKAKGCERHIIKLEELLKEISKRIKKLEEKDISLDEMEDDSAYTLVERYKSKFVKVWNKLCSIKGRAPTTGRTIERKFHFEGTRYPEVNKRIERFINRHKIFPDFHDIFEVVTRCNVKHCLRLGRKTINVIAREAFIDVGNQLQERRIRDFQGNFGCHLTESYRERNDPALYDKELHSKLNTNKVRWKSSLDEVINKFVKQQEMGHDEEEEEEEEAEEAASDGELLHDEQVGSRGTSGERDRDDADKEEVKEEKAAVDAEIDEKRDVEDSGVKKEEEEDLKGKDITTEEMEGDKEEVWEREDGSKGGEIEDRDIKDEVKTESGRRIKPKMGSQEEDELSRPLQAGCHDSVKVASSHGALAAVDCVDNHTSGEPPSADDSDGNNMCDVNTNTREWHNTDDDSNSFNSYDMNIVERDYSDDSKKDEDTETCCNLSSSSSSSSDHYSSSSSNDGSDSVLWKKKNSPDPARCDNSATDIAEAVDEKALCKSPSSDADEECFPDLDTNCKCTDRQHSDSDVLILDETEAQPYSKCMFSPSKLKIQSRDFHLPCFHGLQSDAPIIIDQDDKTTSPTEKSPNNLDDTALVGTMPTCGKYSEQSCSDSKMNIKIKNYRSLSSNIVVKVTTPDSTTSTDCWPALAPQIGKHGATKPCRQQPLKSMALPVVSDEVIELSDSE